MEEEGSGEEDHISVHGSTSSATLQLEISVHITKDSRHREK